MDTASIILLVCGLYAGCGAVFATAFVCVGVSAVDHHAAGAPWSFRVLIWPGALALWPWMLRKWLAARHVEGSSQTGTETHA